MLLMRQVNVQSRTVIGLVKWCDDFQKQIWKTMLIEIDIETKPKQINTINAKDCLNICNLDS